MSHWNENLYPPGGYELVDADKITHTGGSLSDLISKLASYRTRRGLPPGNPIAEVNDYLCGQYPTRCLNGPAFTVDTIKPTGPTLATRMTEWLRATWLKISQKKVEFVSEEESQRRVAICRTCPFHVKFPSECAACSETINQISFQLRAGRDKHTNSLKVCAQFSTDLRVDALTVQQPQPEAPKLCWKRG